MATLQDLVSTARSIDRLIRTAREDFGMSVRDIATLKDAADLLCEIESEQQNVRRDRRRLTRNERLQAMADRGIDTWQDYRGEK